MTKDKYQLPSIACPSILDKAQELRDYLDSGKLSEAEYLANRSAIGTHIYLDEDLGSSESESSKGKVLEILKW